MLSGKQRVLEVGCGDAFGTRIVLQEVGAIYAIDFDPVFVKDVIERMEGRWKFDEVVHTGFYPMAHYLFALCVRKEKAIIQNLTSRRNEMSVSNNLLHPSGIRRVLILGHTGFIGGHLVRYFRKHSPEIELVGRSTSSLDLTKEEEALTLADLIDLKTAVVMCAAIKRQFGDNLDAFSQNLKMVMNLCRLLQNHPVGHLVYFSSAAVYGEETHNTKITEETPVHPTSYYGIAKYTSECLLCKMIDDQEQSSLLILRPPLVYGPGDRGGTYGPSGFVKAAIRRDKITLWGDGSEQREFILVEDLTKIVHRLIFHEYGGMVNVVSGKSYTFKDALDIVSRLVPFKLQIGSRPRTKRKVDNGFCNEALVELLPGISFTSLEEGIKRTFDVEYQTIRRNEHKEESR